MSATSKFPQATSIFAISNTASFLLRKLRDASEIAQLARGQTPESLLANLRKALRSRPLTLEAEVLPYVYIVALSLTYDGRRLRRGAAYKAPFHRWYPEIFRELVDSFKPTSYKQSDVVTPIKILKNYYMAAS